VQAASGKPSVEQVSFCLNTHDSYHWSSHLFIFHLLCAGYSTSL
jgi:hypothetical protein